MSSFPFILIDSKQTPFLKADFFFHSTSELAMRETNAKQITTYFSQTFEQAKTHLKLYSQ